MTEKVKLPPTRASITHKFTIGSCEGYLIVGVDDAGRAMELFVKIAKQGSTMSGLLDGFCRALSLALQYGMPLAKAVDAFIDMRFDPLGQTNNPDIPEARSVLDYVARYLSLNYPTDPPASGVVSHQPPTNPPALGAIAESPVEVSA